MYTTARKVIALFSLVAALLFVSGSTQLFAAGPMASAGQALPQVIVQLSPEGGSGVGGTATFVAAGDEAHAPDMDDATRVSLEVVGLPPNATAQSSLHAGTCAQPGASAAALPNLTADSSGNANASGMVLFRGSENVAFSTVADGSHIIRITSGDRVVACGAIPRQTTAAPLAQSGYTTYTVQRGDTLYSIARRFGTTTAAILQANRNITDPSRIFVGQAIRIPSANNPPPPPAGYTSYTVQRGDTLYSIARRFGTTTAAILQANPNITDASRIYVGQVLRIPTTAQSGPTVTISPLSGPSGTRIDITARGFPPSRAISVKLGAEESEFSQEIASGWTDANGNFTGQGFMTTGTGRWVVGVHTTNPGQQVWAVSAPFVVTAN
jgi:LysM repeat protein